MIVCSPSLSLSIPMCVLDFAILQKGNRFNYVFIVFIYICFIIIIIKLLQYRFAISAVDCRLSFVVFPLRIQISMQVAGICAGVYMCLI